MGAYEKYRTGHTRVRQVVLRVEAWPTGSLEQVDALRGAGVLLCAAFEAYLREVDQEAWDGLSGDWTAMSAAEKRLVANRVISGMGELVARTPGTDLRLPEAERVAAAVTR